MPGSDVTTGFGSKLKIDVGAGLVFVAEIDDIPELPTSAETELYETSSFDTTGRKTYKKHPLKDGVAITITGNYVMGSTGEATLQAADDAADELPYEIHAPQGDDTYVFEGNGLFYGLKHMNPKDSKRTFEITLKPTSAPTSDLAA